MPCVEDPSSSLGTSREHENAKDSASETIIGREHRTNTSTMRGGAVSARLHNFYIECIRAIKVAWPELNKQKGIHHRPLPAQAQGRARGT